MDFLVEVVLEIIGSVIDYKANKTNKKQALSKTDGKTSKEILFPEQRDNKKEKMLEKLEFQTLLLTYMMNEDDGKISFSERKIITNHLNQFKSSIDKSDIKRIRDLLKREISLDTIVRFAKLNNLPEEEINEGIRLLKIIDQEDYHYSEIINKITSRFVIEIEFM